MKLRCARQDFINIIRRLSSGSSGQAAIAGAPGFLVAEAQQRAEHNVGAEINTEVAEALLPPRGADDTGRA